MAIVSLPLPVTLTNGQTADGGQVMTDLNAIASNVNANAAAKGVNSDITQLTALTSITSNVTFSGGMSFNNAQINGATIDGTTTGVTQSYGDNSTKLATTGFVATNYAPLASPALTGTPTAPTAASGTNTTQLATTAFVQQTAMNAALPAQTGNAGKFVTTNGTNASWAYAGISTINTAVTTSTTLSGTYLYVPVAMTALGQSVTLPSALTLSTGGPQYIIDNTKGTYPVGIRDNTGTLIMAVAAGGEALVSLKDNTTQAGVWSVTGVNLEPGLITIDNTFSSTYSSTVLAPFVALDNNTSIHFAALASGFAAFVVDNTGKVLTTPVTVDATASSTPKTVFKVDTTHAIVFYGSSTTTNSCVVLTLSGASPSYSLAVGTPQTYSTALGSNWDGENFTGAPKIAQLSGSLYVASNVNGTNTSVIAISVSGAAITIGAAANIITSSSVAGSTTTYALTATTALVIYASGASAPYTINAVVVSVSGTTCTVGTPAAGGTNSVGASSPVISCLLSPTKALIQTDNNTNTTIQIQAITITGTSVAIGAVLTVESGMTAAVNYYTTSSATRYNPHLWAIGANTAGLWYLDGSSISRVVVLTESSGTVTAGTILYRSISKAAVNSNGFGVISPQGATEFISIKEQAADTANFGLVANACKISGTAITQGSGVPLRDVLQISPVSLPVNRLSSGDYVILPIAAAATSGSNAISVLRSNGDAINMRGKISCPPIGNLTSPQQGNVSSNRIVFLGSTFDSTTVGTTTYQLRLLNIEVAA